MNNDTTIPPDSSSNDNPKAKTRKITNEAKKALHDYFESLNWPLNKELPRGEYANDLKQITEKHGIEKRDQITRQLRNYKNAKYGFSQVKVILGEGQLERNIRLGLGMTSSEFVSSTLSAIINQSSSCSDFNNFSRTLNDFPASAITLMRLFSNDKESPCCILLTNLIDGWIKFAGELFPKSVAELSGAELKFQDMKRIQKWSFAKKWMKLHQSDLGQLKDVDVMQFGNFGVFLFNLLFMNWSHHAVDCERPAVTFPEDCLV